MLSVISRIPVSSNKDLNNYRHILTLAVIVIPKSVNCTNCYFSLDIHNRVEVKYSTCTWYLYLSTYLSVLDVLEYLVYGNAKVLVLVLDQEVLGTYK